MVSPLYGDYGELSWVQSCHLWDGLEFLLWLFHISGFLFQPCFFNLSRGVGDAFKPLSWILFAVLTNLQLRFRIAFLEQLAFVENTIFSPNLF